MPEASVPSRRRELPRGPAWAAGAEPGPPGPTGSGEADGASTPGSRLPLVAGIALVVLLSLSLHLSSRVKSSLEEHLAQRLRVAAELTADALAGPSDVDLAAGGILLARLEAIRHATSVSEIWLYGREGQLIGGAAAGKRAAAVPGRVRLGTGGGEAPADPALREPARDAAGGLALLVPLPRNAAAGALLVRIDREAQGGLPTIDFLFNMAKALAAVVTAAGFLILLRWLLQGPPAVRAASAQPSSDVELVLGTVKEVMSTLKDSESDYRDRWTAAEADAEHWRLTNDRILESITSGIVAFESGGRITMFNHAAEEILGIPARSARGRHILDVFAPDDPLGRHAAELERHGRPAARTETERADPAGNARWLSVTSSVLRRDDGEGAGGILLVSDLTETKQLRDQMELKDRLSAVGEMSAGIAHEIKNSLHSLMGFANLLREDFTGEEPMAVRGILDEVRSLEAMVKGVLEFSRPSALVKAPTSVNDLAREVAAVAAEAGAKAGVEVRLELDPALPEARLDGEAVRRACLNLALNAVEAMEDGGTLTIATRTAEPTGETGAPAPAVRISFRDTGPGIPESERNRIFTPFWSTKRDGSGLGLALAHKTVTDHGGRLHLLSRVGVGTEFVIHLPVEG